MKWVKSYNYYNVISNDKRDSYRKIEKSIIDKHMNKI